MDSERLLEFLDKARGHLIYRQWTGQLLSHTCRLDTLHAAGNDQLEWSQIHVHVQREAMTSHPPTDMDANRGDFSPCHPHARPADPTTGSDPESGEGFDQDPLESSEVAVQVAAMIGHIQDRIPHQLARPVIGHVAAPLHVQEPDPERGERGFGYQKVALVPATSEGDDGRVLEQQQEVPYLPLGPKCRKATLQR